MERLFSLIFKYKWLFLIFTLILTLTLGYGMSRLEIRSILEGDLPESDFIIRTNNEFKQVFGDKSYVVFAFEHKSGLVNAESLKKLNQFTQELRIFPGINKEEILSLSTFAQVEDSDDGLVIEPLLESIPVSQAQTLAFIELLKNNPIIWLRLISGDLTTTLISAPIDKTTEETQVYQAAKSLVAKYQSPEIISAYSFQIIDEAIDEGINQDLAILFPLAIIIIGLLFYFCFANLRSVILPLLAMVMAVVATMGLMGWLGFKVSTVTSIIPVLIISLGSSYAIHLLERYFTVKKMQSRRVLSQVAKPILLAGLTSAIGFFTLVVFKIISLCEFGIFSALGIIFMIYYVLVFCPAMLFILPQKGKVKTGLDFFDRATNYLLNKIFAVTKKTKLVLIATIILFVLAVMGISQLQVGSNPTEFFPHHHPVRQASELFNEKFGATGIIEVMFECQASECILQPEILQKIWQFQEYSESLEAVGYTNSIINALRYINKSLNNTETVPQSASLISQYLLLYSMNKTVDLGMYLDHPRQRLKVTIWMNIDDSQIIEQSYKKMKAYLDANLPAHVTAKFGGENMEWIAQNHYIVTGKIINIIASILIILLVCSLVFRSFKLGLLAILPLTYSTILVFGVMGFVGIRLDLASCILTGVTVGVGVDFAIHYLSRLLENNLTRTDLDLTIKRVNFEAGKPILYDALSNILGFSVLLFSSFTPVKDFGALIGLSMITCSLGTLIFLPILSPKLITMAKEAEHES